MERNGDIARPQSGAQGRIKSDRLWQQLTDTLNSMGGGIAKPSEKWKKVWADWKSKSKNKSKEIRNHSCGTGGGPNCKITLTALEERVLAVMGVLAVEGQAAIEEIDRRQTYGNISFGVDIILPDVASSDVGIEELAGSSTLTNEPPATPRPQPVTSPQQSVPPAQTATAASTSRREATPPTPTMTRSPADAAPPAVCCTRNAEDRRKLLLTARPVSLRPLNSAAYNWRSDESKISTNANFAGAVEAEAYSVLKRLDDVAERFLNREH